MGWDVTPLSNIDSETICAVVNAAAATYEGVIPDDQYSEPYMPVGKLREERRKMDFYGVRDDGRLLGVIGVQSVDGVTLVRHLYVRPEAQREGVGSALLSFALEQSPHEQVYVGTWRDATWAVDFYESHGFENLGPSEDLLVRYWDVPPDQRAASVVLALETAE
jgi:GNAT superfamily N-acetyltransferase